MNETNSSLKSLYTIGSIAAILQLVAIASLRSKDFSKVTAYSGLLGNGLDFIQHVLHIFLPSVSSVIAMFMGVFYFVWFPMLAWDFFKLARSNPSEV